MSEHAEAPLSLQNAIWSYTDQGLWSVADQEGGAGLPYDGLYFVRQVTHTIVPGTSYTQSFSLSREGTVSTLPAVPL